MNDSSSTAGPELRFWGVRGSVPTPVAQNLGFGGNTPCLEVRIPEGDVYIFDAGTGIRELGIELASSARRHAPIHVFLTHYHWDHIQGLPFFEPLYDPATRITFYASKFAEPLKTSLAGQMACPYFPVPFAELASRSEFVSLDSEVRFPGLTVRPFQLNHPQGAAGYRIEARGSVVVYATDREHGDARLDALMRDHAQGADLLIHDTQYTASEYESCRGRGHSTPEEAVSVARDSRVRGLVLFHHDPAHDDAFLERMVQDARAHFAETLGAREGVWLDL